MPEHPSTEQPIQPEITNPMNQFAKVLDELLNGQTRPKKWAFALLVFPFGEGSDHRANYISNAEREDMIASMKEFIARNELRYVDEAARNV